MSSLLLRGFVLGFAVAASPGPIFFLCLRRTLVRGWLIGVASGFGVATADGFYAALAVFGVGALTSVVTGDRRWFALVGGLVLLGLGIRTLLERPKTVEATTVPSATGIAWAYISTLGLTITNPATIISFAALVAALGVGISGGYLRPALVVLGVLLGSAAWWCFLAFLATGLRTRVTPGVVRGISTLSGVAIVALGLLAVVSAVAGN